jgi:molybdopterin/thiamine biosynthesis adenylyltransferase
MGLGGLGGVALEILVRSGVQRFAIADKDVFEPSNLNRQVFAVARTLGQRKIDVAEEWARSINPDVSIEKFDRVSEENVAAILEGAAVVVLAIDQLVPCLILSRKARELGIPVVEGWAIPYGNVRVISAETPSLEETYGLPTQGRPIASFSPEELKDLQRRLLLGLRDMEGLDTFYGDLAMARLAKGEITSFAPIVWLTAVLMALEATKILLGWGKAALGPQFALYDPYHLRIPRVSKARGRLRRRPVNPQA